MITTTQSYATRWRILQRDNFTCGYCGQHAPDVILHVDHRIPKSEGGTDEDTNLTSSCEACNIGKHTSSYYPQNNIEERRPRINGMERAVIATIIERGALSATELAKITGYHRVNISKFLNHSPNMMKAGKEKATVRFSLL